MKKSHIIGIVVIAVSMAFLVSSFFEASTYADFGEAFGKSGKEFHVVGSLDEGFDIVYEPEVNPNLTVFHMKDEKGESRKVMLYKSKPQDFEKAETIVLIGSAVGEDFHAEDILMKCPSKYEEGQNMEAAANG